MNRTKLYAFVLATVLAVFVGLAGVGTLGRWMVPTSSVAVQSEPAVVVDEAPPAPPAPEYTRLTPNEPDGLPAVVPYGGTARDGVVMIAADAEPAIWSNDWKEGLTGAQMYQYAQGLVRSGMEDLNMCKPGYTCHAAIRYRIYEQTSSPQEIRLQMTFTTRFQHNEMFLFVREGRGKVWFNNGGGWNFTGDVEELPENDQNTVYKLMSCSSMDDSKY